MFYGKRCPRYMWTDHQKQLKNANSELIFKMHVHFITNYGFCRGGNTLDTFTVVTPCTNTLGILLTKPTSWTKPLRGDASVSWWLECRRTDVRIVNNVNLKKKKNSWIFFKRLSLFKSICNLVHFKNIIYLKIKD